MAQDGPASPRLPHATVRVPKAWLKSVLELEEIPVFDGRSFWVASTMHGVELVPPMGQTVSSLHLIHANVLKTQGPCHPQQWHADFHPWHQTDHGWALEDPSAEANAQYATHMKH